VAPVRAEINTVQVTGKVYADAQEIKPLNKDKNIPDCHEQYMICHGNHNFRKM